MSRRMRAAQRGIGLVENLVAISLLGISLMGATSLFVSSYNSDSAARSYTSLINDVHSIIDGYRSATYSSLLDKYGTGYANIVDGQQVSETAAGLAARANYTITFTAIRTTTTNIPEAVRVNVTANQRRGKFSNGIYRFETIIAQTR